MSDIPSVPYSFVIEPPSYAEATSLSYIANESNLLNIVAINGNSDRTANENNTIISTIIPTEHTIIPMQGHYQHVLLTEPKEEEEEASSWDFLKFTICVLIIFYICYELRIRPYKSVLY